MRKLFILSALAACVSANAAVFQVGTRAALAGNDSIDWGQFGPTYTNLGTSELGSTTNGTKFLVSSSDLERRDQGNGWNGAFNTGDKVLWNVGYNGGSDMTIQFAATQGAIGFDIHTDYYGAFTGTMKAYDGLGSLLGTVSVNGVASATPGTAPFLGIRSTQMDIAKVVISAYNIQNDFAINQVTLGNCQAVPEPASMAALGLGVVGLLKRRKKA